VFIDIFFLIFSVIATLNSRYILSFLKLGDSFNDVLPGFIHKLFYLKVIENI